MANLQWLTHKGKKVLLLDFRRHSGTMVEQLAREVQQVITAQPRGSVRVLADFTGARFTEEAGKQIAKVAVADRPYVARTAWWGQRACPRSGLTGYEIILSATFTASPPGKRRLNFWWATD